MSMRWLLPVVPPMAPINLVDMLLPEIFCPSSELKKFIGVFPTPILVMHGSSSVPQDWLAVINDNGGEIPETYGVPVEQICEGIKYGVHKINMNTDLSLPLPELCGVFWQIIHRLTPVAI